jgi:demethylmenaquinone methyltransferase/2-methoxy-6-polyprenyl-1,4-benzoquinol methylase
MKRLSDLDVDAHLADPTIKQRFVTPMFDVIAPRYDRFTRLFSFGMDVRWKAALMAEVAAVAQGHPVRDILDLACGTGDLAFAAGRTVPGATVIGLDASPRMIAEARTRAAGATGAVPAFRVGDMGALDMPDASADVITAGYGYRNAPDHRVALAEAARVLRPGGTLLTLDFYRPEHPVWRALFLWYLRRAGDLVGWWWHRDPVIYGYIAPSIAHFVSAGEFTRDAHSVGLEGTALRRWLFGGVALHRFTRR